jgi:hypothetical protein
VRGGSYRFVCEDLPKGFIESSLRVEGTGSAAVKIIGIDLERREKPADVSPRFAEMNTKMAELRRRYAELKIKHDAVGARKELAASIGDFSLEKAQDQLARETFSVQDWQVLLDFYEKEKAETEGRLEELSRELRKRYKEIEWMQSELEAMRVPQDVVKAVVVDCDVTAPGTLRFDISYIVSNAGWKPEYTTRYLERDGMIELTYNARIQQSTGEDWDDVSVLLSTAKPHIGAAPPDLSPHYLLLGTMGGRITGRVYDAKTGDPLPYANVVVVGTKQGGMTRSDGRYTIQDVPAGRYRVKAMMMGYRPVEWSNVVVHGGRPTETNFELESTIIGMTQEIVVEAEVEQVDVSESKVSHRTSGDELHVRGGRSGEVEHQIKPPTVLYMQADVTSSEFAANLQIQRPLDLETGAEPKRSLVVREKLPGSYTLYGVPRKSENVFVEGTFKNTIGIPLLAGQSEVYVETAPAPGANPVSNFVGRETIDPVADGQEFTLHLGVDQDIRIEHKLDRKERLSKSGKKTAKIRYRYVITIENFKEEPAEIRIMDRLPVSMLKEVKVEDVDIVPAPVEEGEDGILVWKVGVDPGATKKIRVAYTIAFPGDWSEDDFNLVD